MGGPREGQAGALTELQRRILQFFREHPHAVETVRGISAWVGREGEAIGEALRGLAQKGWLTADETSAVTGYALTRDEHLLSQMQQMPEAG